MLLHKFTTTNQSFNDQACACPSYIMTSLQIH